MAEKILRIENDDLSGLYGEFDAHIRLIERELEVAIINRDDYIKINGEAVNVDYAANVLNILLDYIKKGEVLNEQNIRYTISMVLDGISESLTALTNDCVCITAKGKPIKPKTLGQKKYIEAISGNTITFGIGPAGTGKTYLAVAAAVTAFRNKEVSRIILTRPAVEAGEKLGFLPGDLRDKVDPYLRPLYDSMQDMLGGEGYLKHLERGAIEVAPLAYMRGRTLDDSFIILDEAQNTTPEQMKMFLTRIGFSSKVVVTGDITQIDLSFGNKSGLKEAMKILKNIEGIEFMMLTDKDVVRHPLIQKIIKAYEVFDKKREGSKKYVKKDGGRQLGFDRK